MIETADASVSGAFSPRPRAAGPRRWYFAANRQALIGAFDQIAVAVTSARMRTSLEPCCLIDNDGDLGGIADRLSWLERCGVTLLFHRAEMFARARERFGAGADRFSAHWLRCDIPILEKEHEFVLYTDIDVLFRNEIDYSNVKPIFLAAAPEFNRDDSTYFNSGIMVMNIATLRTTRPLLLSTLATMLEHIEPFNDQAVLNATYERFWDRLPDLWNWKPYWGRSSKALVVHFHGPKPGAARQMLCGKFDGTQATHQDLFRRDPEAYAAYMTEYDKFLTASLAMCDEPQLVLTASGRQ